MSDSALTGNETDAAPSALESARDIVKEGADDADIILVARAYIKACEALEEAQRELSDLADKVRSAGMAGHFENWQPACRRARRVLKKLRTLSCSAPPAATSGSMSPNAPVSGDMREALEVVREIARLEFMEEGDTIECDVLNGIISRARAVPPPRGEKG